jgi:hypothetical protein
MKKYSIWHIPFMSFYSSDLYRDIGLNWKGICFGYLVLLLAVCWVPGAVQVHLLLSSLIQNEAPDIVSQMPTITIKDGIATSDVPQPHTITSPKTGKTLVIIDSTGKYTSLDKTDALALITKDRVFLKWANEVNTIEFKNIKDLKIDRQQLNEWIDMAGKYLPVIYYVRFFVQSFALKMTQLLIFGAIGLFIASWMKINLRYAAALRLSAAAITPGIVIETIGNNIGIPIPYADTLLILVAMWFLYFGIKAVSQRDNQQSTGLPFR